MDGAFALSTGMAAETTPTPTSPTPGPGSGSAGRKLPPVLGRLLSGSFWLALRAPMQAVFSLWTIPLILQAGGKPAAGAYGFAWTFGFLQFLLEFGMSSALQRQVAETWTRGDRDGVNRSIACGMSFYAAMALVQIAALLGVAYLWLPHLDITGPSRDLVVKLLWLQAVTAPCYGLSVVVSSVLQAARRYDFIPRLELVVIVGRFVVLYVGVNAGFDFFAVIVVQTAVQLGLALLPALWVMVRELGYAPHFRGARLADYKALMHISFFVFLLQLSVVLADKLDKIVLVRALSGPGAPADPVDSVAVYDVVSKPFLQVRQSGWMLAYFVMPAVASLIAARDVRGLERVKYDGTRLHLAAILPVALLAFVHAAPFLTLWVGDRLDYDAALDAPLLRLFLVATIPLVLSVPVQMSLGMNKVEVVAVSALAGSLVNLPVSYVLTRHLGVAGVIWGTVLTTLFSNLLIPGVYLFRVLEVRPRTFLTRTLGPPAAGAGALLAAAGALHAAWPLHPTPAHGLSPLTRWLPLAAQLAVGSLAYALGYLATRTGRTDVREVLGKLRRRPA